MLNQAPGAPVPASAGGAPPGANDGAALPRGRMLVFLIDSLRYETATDPALMPNLVALRGESTFARVKATRDAVTVPSIRAAFTGEDGTRILAFVTNFLRGSAGTESVFTDLGAQGRKGATLSDAAFAQFGGIGRDEFSNGDDGPTEVHDQNAAVDRAIELYRSGKYALCVMHVTYTDHIAHETGVGSAPYVARFADADRMVQRLAAATRPEDTFMVMGDHGHDLNGRHTFGLDVPTIALYRGPRFRAGRELGTIAIRDHRYLMGWALGLGLPPGYGGGRHPDALVSSSPLPPEYAAVAGSGAGVAVGSGSPGRRAGYVATIAILCVLLVAWVRLLLPRGDPAAAPTRPVLGAALLGVAGPAFAVAGVAFPVVRPWLHEPHFSTVAATWGALWLFAFTVARLRRDAALGWPILALPLFALFPTVYRYGAAAALGPAWMGFALCSVIATVTVPGGPSLRPRSLAVLALALAMLYPFSAAEASDYRFDTWVFYPVEVGGGAGVWVVLALVAKIVLFVRPGLRAPVQLSGGVAALLLVAAEVGRVPSMAALVLGVALFVVAWRASVAARSSGAAGDVSHVGRVAFVAGCLLLFRGLTQAAPETYLWLDCLLAALLASGHLVALVVPPSSRRVAYALLLLFAWVGTGWISFAWTVHRLEWHFLYDWFAAPSVERHVGLFLPLILARYLLPLIAARALLAESLGRPEPEARRLVWTLAGAKVLSLLLFTAGIGWASSQSDLYLEAAEESGIGTVLAAGLL